MNSGIYRIRNVLDDKCYVGSAKCFTKREKEHFRLLKKNMHWNELQRAFNKYGGGNFVFEICEYTEYTVEITQLEDQWIAKLNSKKNGYNIADASFGDQLSNHPNRDQIIEKISAGVRKTFSEMSEEERKQKFGLPGHLNPMFGKKRPEHVLNAMRDGTYRVVQETGHGPTFGIKKSDTHRAKMSANAKERVGNKNPFFGKQHAEESKAKMSERAKGRKCATARAVIMHGIRYEKLKDAADAADVPATTIHYRASSDNPKFDYVFFEDSPKESRK